MLLHNETGKLSPQTQGVFCPLNLGSTDQCSSTDLSGKQSCIAIAQYRAKLHLIETSKTTSRSKWFLSQSQDSPTGFPEKKGYDTGRRFDVCIDQSSRLDPGKLLRSRRGKASLADHDDLC